MNFPLLKLCGNPRPAKGLLSCRQCLAALLAAGSLTLCTASQGQTAPSPQQYSQGEPTNDEQYLLYLLNRARQNPPAEGQRLAAYLNEPAQAVTVSYYHLNPNQIAADFAAIPAKPPLAFDARLIAAARGHSADLAPLDGNSPDGNSHDGTDGSTPSSRVAATGLPATYSFGTENFAPGLSSAYQTHAGFLIDWGVPSLGHRINAMSINSLFGVNLIGIGVATKPPGVNPSFPLVTTEDFASPALSYDGTATVNADAAAILTGVVYHDANGNGQYDPGEGVAGVRVSLAGGLYYAVTTASGGYSFPLVNLDGSFANGDVTVRMSGLTASSEAQRTVTINRYPTPYGTYRGNVEWNNVTGSSSAVVAPGNTDPLPAAFFHGAAALSNGYYYLAFANGNVFGYYNVNAYPYLYHADLGFEYVFDANDGQGGVYLYDFKSGGFFYTSPTFSFPYLYDFSLGSTVYYYPDPSNPGRYNTNGVRYFFVFHTGQIVSK